MYFDFIKKYDVQVLLQLIHKLNSTQLFCSKISQPVQSKVTHC